MNSKDFRTVAGHKIDEIEFDDGTLLLRSRNRSAAPEHGLEASEPVREPARIITMAWGDRYVSDLLSITIPAILSPGNLPAFAPQFDCQLVIVTESRLFDQISRSPVIARVLELCDVRLVPIEDLLSPWYGITLTYALVRGFVDLGADMTKTHLVFFNADFIVADGSYAKLAEKIRDGERLVVSPSYCMVLEETVEHLMKRYDPVSCSISVSRREMAAMILEHRHNTIRAKTVNQRLFRIHRYDQFYWNVDAHTLLGRQMPIAVIYMRPERVVLEMPTFWDYGVISEFCPTIKPCVLSDSDDFLMGELREAGTFRELLRLGWPTVAEIAADLSSFTTQDHRDYGRYELVLHSRDLPKDLDRSREKLNRFVQSVFDRLSPPISYFNHPFWAEAFPRFRQIHAEQSRSRRVKFEVGRALRHDADYLGRLRQVKVLEERVERIEAESLYVREEIARKQEKIDRRLAEIDTYYRSERDHLIAVTKALDVERDAQLLKLAERRSDCELRKQKTLETNQAEIDLLSAKIIARLDDPTAPLPGALGDLEKILAAVREEIGPVGAEAIEPKILPSPPQSSGRSQQSSGESEHPVEGKAPDRAVTIAESEAAEEGAPASSGPKNGSQRLESELSPKSALSSNGEDNETLELKKPGLDSWKGKPPIWLRWSSALYRRIFGKLPKTTKWHPLHSVIDPAFSAISRSLAAGARNVLIISSGSRLGALMVSEAKVSKKSISTQMLHLDAYVERLFDGSRFDLCVCDLELNDLSSFNNLIQAVQPHLVPGAKIVAFYRNRNMQNLNDWTFNFTQTLFPVIGSSEISFSGSLAGVIAMRGFDWVLYRYNIARIPGFFLGGLVLAYCAPFAWLASCIDKRRTPYVMPKRCTSMTIELQLDPD